MPTYLTAFASPYTRERKSQRYAGTHGDGIATRILQQFRAQEIRRLRPAFDATARVEAARKFVVGQRVLVPGKRGVVWAQIESIILATGSIHVYVSSMRKTLNFAADVIDELNTATVGAVQT